METPSTADRIEKTVKVYSNVKTLVVAAVTAIGVIFAAGIYYANLRQELDTFMKRVAALETQVVSLEASRSNLVQQLNAGFEQLANIQNVGSPYRNNEPLNNGGGNNATEPPGRCQIGQVVVGIQPFKEGSGQRAIIMQCGTVPKIAIK